MIINKIHLNKWKDKVSLSLSFSLSLSLTHTHTHNINGHKEYLRLIIMNKNAKKKEEIMTRETQCESHICSVDGG